jgi:hypothetical protein
MAGYSQTPLLKKLNFRPEQVNYVDNFSPYFDEVKEAITLNAPQPYDFIHIFVRNPDELERSMTFALTKLAKTGCLWVSWPKKKAKVQTDIDENIIREFGLSHGVVDVKVAAIDETWSGLKFVYRLKDR